MLAKEIVKLMEPRQVIGCMEKGLHGKRYIGRAVNAIEREDLMESEVDSIGLELIENSFRMCVFVKSA